MRMDRDTWRHVGTLFDQLSRMAPHQRGEFLGSNEVPPEVRALLDRLLQAHDADDESLLDRAVDDLAGELLFDRRQEGVRVPEHLAGKRFGKWRALEAAGKGGMGVVLRGERADGEFSKEVAIKLLPPGLAGADRLQRLRSEIRLLARLDHPGIARLLDSGISEEGVPYLVMEYVDGVPIDRYCLEHRLSIEERVEMVICVAESTAYSHARLVVHCDIKPANVLVSRIDDQPAQIKLVDFGIAALLADKDAGCEWSPTLHCSPAYASPEQLEGEPPAVAQDIYLLGGVLYRLLTGQAVRNARRATSLLLGQPAPDSPIQPPSSHPQVDGGAGKPVDRELDAICLKALAPEPEKRYTDVGKLIDDLRAWRQSRPVAAVDGGPGYHLRKWLTRNRLVAASMSLAVVALVAGSAIALWQAREASQAAAALQIESDRTRHALAETEQALGRAEALHEFLLDLFRSAEPDRPSDQLPSSEEILGLGARRAMDPDAAHPPERLGMLLTIALVYMQQNRFEAARPLLKEAVELARSSERDADLAQSLHRKAQLLWRIDRDFEQSLTLLEEGEELVAGDQRQFGLFVELRTERGWVERLAGNHDRALSLLSQVEQRLAEGDTLQPRTASRFNGALATLYMDAGDLERAAQLSTRAMELEGKALGPESIYYAIQLVNSAAFEDQLGRFEEAERRLHKAISIYDRSFQGPSRYRAMAYNNLAQVLLETGRFEAAMQAIEANVRDRSGAEGVDPETWSYAYYRRGTNLARTGFREQAVAQLSRALELNQDYPAISDAAEARIEVLLALLACQAGEADQGLALLADQPDSVNRSANTRAEFKEASAVCHYGAGNYRQALDWIGRTHEIDAPPGQILDRSRRLLLEVRIQRALGDEAAARQLLERVEALLRSFGLDQHPILESL